MCQKQCRDENGFKCHTMSESHLRQMRVYSEDPARIMEEFSNEVGGQVAGARTTYVFGWGVRVYVSSSVVPS